MTDITSIIIATIRGPRTPEYAIDTTFTRLPQAYASVNKNFFLNTLKSFQNWIVKLNAVRNTRNTIKIQFPSEINTFLHQKFRTHFSRGRSVPCPGWCVTCWRLLVAYWVPAAGLERGCCESAGLELTLQLLVRYLNIHNRMQGYQLVCKLDQPMIFEPSHFFSCTWDIYVVHRVSFTHISKLLYFSVM